MSTHENALVATSDTTSYTTHLGCNKEDLLPLHNYIRLSGSPQVYYLDDKYSSQLIRSFIFAGKPKGASPVCCAIVTLLLSVSNAGHPNFSQQEIADMLGCDIQTVRKALRTLSQLGWVTQVQHGHGQPKELTVHIYNLPD
jgi:hypothetical protein